MSCSEPDNIPIYHALLVKSAEYPPHKPYHAKAYAAAAERVAQFDFSLYNSWATPRILYEDFGPSTAHFIEDYIRMNPQPVPQDADDTTIAKHIQNFCSQYFFFYNDNLISEYRTWRQNKGVTYDTIKELIYYWARNKSITLLKQQRDKDIDIAINEYCYYNKIRYSPEYITVFHAWAEDPANMDSISNYWTHNGLLYRVDKSPKDCVKKWFSTLNI